LNETIDTTYFAAKGENASGREKVATVEIMGAITGGLGIIVAIIFLIMIYKLILGGPTKGFSFVKVFMSLLFLIAVFSIVSATISDLNILQSIGEHIIRYWPGGDILWDLHKQTPVSSGSVALTFVKLLFVLPIKLFLPSTFILGLFMKGNGKSGVSTSIILRIPQCLLLGIIDFLLTVVAGWLVSMLVDWLVAVHILNIAHTVVRNVVLVGVPLVIIAILVLTVSKFAGSIFRFGTALYLAKILIGLFVLLSWTFGKAIGMGTAIVCFFVSGLLTLIGENETMTGLGGGIFFRYR
jgi:hypothetical protein